MTVLPVVALSGVILLLAYRIYGRLIMKWLGVQPDRPTPAVTEADGLDYVPAPPGVVLGGHFTAIAAAGRWWGRSSPGWRSGGGRRCCGF